MGRRICRVAILLLFLLPLCYEAVQEANGPACPEFRLDFHSGYDDEKQDIFRQMCDCRRKYVEEQQKKEFRSEKVREYFK